jgi:hypothetical protein
MFNERSPSYSPYPVRSPSNGPFQPTLPSAIRTSADTAAINAQAKSYLLQKVQALLPYLS